ncbi:MAG: hypothetical protein ACJAXB_002295 [Candidatus Endobugula sp.]
MITEPRVVGVFLCLPFLAIRFESDSLEIEVKQHLLCLLFGQGGWGIAEVKNENIFSRNKDKTKSP